jgi:hypothetical protein
MQCSPTSARIRCAAALAVDLRVLIRPELLRRTSCTTSQIWNRERSSQGIVIKELYLSQLILIFAQYQECVVCRKTFINESDAMQWEQSHQTTVIRGQLSSAPTLNVPNPSVSTITDLTGDGSRSQDRPRARTAQAPSQSAARVIGSLGFVHQALTESMQIPVVTAAPTLQSHQATTSSSQVDEFLPSSLCQFFSLVQQASSRPLPDETVGASIDALKQALDALRTCLVQETASVSTMDVAAVGTIAESMGRTAQALVHVEQLRKRT